MVLLPFRVSRTRVLVMALLVIAGFFVYDAAVDRYQSARTEREKAAVAAEIARLEEKKTYLEAVREYAASDAYVEQQARRQLGWARDGEVPFVVTSPPLPQSETKGDWWERLFPR